MARISTVETPSPKPRAVSTTSTHSTASEPARQSISEDTSEGQISPSDIPNYYRDSLSSFPPTSPTTSEADSEVTPSTPTRQRTPRPRLIRTTHRSSGSQSTPRAKHAPPRSGLRYASTASASSAEPASEGEAQVELPLVLLHVTLLPLPAPLSSVAANGILSSAASSRLQRLRAKVVGEVASRGLLITHPGADFACLEERVLQGLDLQTGRITKDGHFDLSGQEASQGDDEARVDSGTEMESPGKRQERCDVCRSRIAHHDDGVDGGREWDVKVFAANGLLTAQTWATSWKEMERVDVLVAPWLDDETKARLDVHCSSAQPTETASADHSLEAERGGDESRHVTWLHEQEMMLRIERLESALISSQRSQPAGEASDAESGHVHDMDLPPAFHPHQIPTETLLRNYLLILAKDTRNIVIAGLLILTTLLAFQVAVRGQASRSFDGTKACEALGQKIADSLSGLASSNLMTLNGPVNASEHATSMSCLHDSIGHSEIKQPDDAEKAALREGPLRSASFDDIVDIVHSEL